MNTQTYCNPIGYMWVSNIEIPEYKPETIKDNDYICQVVSRITKVPIEQIKRKCRKRAIVIARQLSVYFAKEYTTMTLKAIAKEYGYIDHSTAIHCIYAVNDSLDTDKRFRVLFDRIKEELA